MSVTLVRIKTRFCSVTPLYLHGADMRKAELRLSSIKGALRYWYRAACPDFSKKTDSGITNEELLFGGTKGKAGQSAFLMRLVKEEEIQVRRGKYNQEYFASVRFELEFLLRPNLGKDVKPDWRGLLVSIWLLGHLGGLGAKSRKGYGAIALESWSVEGSEEIQAIMDDFPIAHGAKLFEEWEEKLRTGWENIVGKGYHQAKKQGNTILNANSSLYIQEKEIENAENMNSKGIDFINNFRLQHKKEKFIFRTPLKLKVEFGPRRLVQIPSPVWIKVFKINKQYYPAFLFLSIPFPVLKKKLKDGKKITILNPNDAVRSFKANLEANNYRRICGHE